MSMDVHSRFGFLPKLWGPQLPHSDSKDLSPFFDVLGLYISCSWNKDGAKGWVKGVKGVELSPWQRAQSVLSSWKGLQLAIVLQVPTAVLQSSWVKLSWTMCCHPCSLDPHFPGRTKEKELSSPAHATISLPRQHKHWLWAAAKFLVWDLNPWPPRQSNDATSWVTQAYFLSQWLNRSKGMQGISFSPASPSLGMAAGTARGVHPWAQLSGHRQASTVQGCLSAC